MFNISEFVYCILKEFYVLYLTGVSTIFVDTLHLVSYSLHKERHLTAHIFHLSTPFPNTGSLSHGRRFGAKGISIIN
jgi:hypothetical protein